MRLFFSLVRKISSFSFVFDGLYVPVEYRHDCLYILTTELLIPVVIYFSVQISLGLNIYKRIKIMPKTRDWENFKQIVFCFKLKD